MSSNAKDHIARAQAKAKTHLEKPRTEAGALSVGICGALGGRMVDDVVAFKGLADAARCKRCDAAFLRATQAERDAKPGKVLKPNKKGAVSGAEIGRDLMLALKATLGRASVDPPPVMTHELWRSSCRGAVDKDSGEGSARCKNCWACERDAKLEHIARDEDPYNQPLRLNRPLGSPMWSSLNAAISAWCSSTPEQPSPSGAMLDKARLGLLGKQPQASKPEDRNANRAGDLVIITRLMALAYPPDAHPTLTSGRCVYALIERCVGVEFSYETLASAFGVDPGDVRAVVKHGRTFLTVELAARGLIPMPAPRGLVSHQHIDMVEAIEHRAAELARVRDELQRASAQKARAPSHGARGLVAHG